MNIKIKALLIFVIIFTSSIQAIAKEDNAELFPVFQIVLENNPNVKVAIASIMAAKGNFAQSGLIPNPNVIIEVENFGGNNNLSGFNSAEMTFGIEQEIEIAGKRSYRQNVARFGLEIAQQEAYSNIMAILADAHFLYVNYVLAQERLKLAEKRVQLSYKTHDAVKNRVTAAAASEIQHAKVDIEQKIAAIEKNKSVESLISAKAKFESVLSTGADLITLSKEILLVPFNLPDKDEVITALNSLPRLEMIKLKKLQARSNVELAKAYRIPNPTIGAGFRHFKESNSNAFLTTFSIPIPIFNRNQGDIARAQAEYLSASSEVRLEYLTLKETTEKIYEQMISASYEVKSYREFIIPSAQKAYNQAADGYKSGRFSFLELLDSQRTLYEIQEAHLNSLLKFHQAKAQVDFLLGVNKGLVKNLVSINN